MDFKIILIATVGLVFVETTPQSNYGLQGNDIEYTNPNHEPHGGLPPTATLAGKVTELDTLAPQIKLNRTSASLNCADGSMKVQLSFKEPFYGLAYSDFDRASACFAQGTGNTVINLELPLKGCGTRQDPQRVFTNNIVVRFHHGFEMEGDEVVTIVCRYPPPIVQPPPPIPAPVVIEPITAPIPKPLKEFEILLIICAILFLGLMLLGMGCSYYCLRHRNIQVYRKRPFSAIDEEESEKQSAIDSFQNLKIPRVHPPSESSSEVPLEETLGSDYPSSIEDAPIRPETVSSEYSDAHAQIHTALIPPTRIRKPTEFAVNLRVAKQPETNMSYSETEGSISSFDTGFAKASHVADFHPPPRKRSPPTVFSKATTQHEPMRSVQETEHVNMLTTVDREDLERQTRYGQQQLALRKPEVSIHTVDDVYLQTIVERRLIEDEERRVREVTQFYKKDDPKWDVVIRTTEIPDDEAWERGSETTDVASSVGWSTVEEPIRLPQYTAHEREMLNRRTDTLRQDLERTTVSHTMQKLQQDDDTQSWNAKWQVLLRVLESPPRTMPPTTSTIDFDNETPTLLTADDREKWRRIITTESTLRSLLTEATVREDYERIRRDIRYEKLFDPEKWDVIIRVLAPPTDQSYYGNEDSMSEISSVSSGMIVPPVPPVHHRRKKSTAESTAESRKSEVRSMTEMMVSDYTSILGRHTSGGDDSLSLHSGGRTQSVGDRSQSELIDYPSHDSILRGSTSGNFHTEDTTHSRSIDEGRGLVTESRATKSTFSSSRLTRF